MTVLWQQSTGSSDVRAPDWMEPVFNLFKDIGVTEQESQVYLYLVKKGSTKARVISQALKISRVQLYRILKNLEKKGMVESSFEYPTLFNAIPISKVLDFFVDAKKEEARNLEARKKELIAQLDLYQPDNRETISNKFMVLEGRSYIYSRIAQMIQGTEKTLLVVSSGAGVVEAYRSGLFDHVFNNPAKKEVFFRFLTSFSTIANNVEVAKDMLRKAEKNSLSFGSRIGNFGAESFPRFVIKDTNELLIFLRMTENEFSTDQDDTGLWTNNLVLVHAFLAFFEDLWRNSIDLKDRMKDQ
ncbi:MAG: TrmB family transcriptional regulator [Candidatus Bathyarchaeia archaeon]